jgi:hypothetical protein
MTGMTTAIASSPRSNGRPGATIWAGRIMTAVAVVFLVFDAGTKLADIGPVADAQRLIGFPLELDRWIGAIELVCLALYVAPPTAVLGAILLTGYLGGAVASHLRLLDPLFSHTLFGVYVGLLVWGGLWLRDPRVRTLVPLRR